jgi:flagellin
MAIGVRTNIASIRATRSLRQSRTSLTSSLERISSGRRINRSADDAAGLSVGARMESDRTSLSQAMRNINDGISMLQTAEGSLNEVYNLLTRMHELAIQGYNSFYESSTSSDENGLGHINREYNELVDEMRRIVTTSNFNNVNLLNVDAQTDLSHILDLQIGLQANSNHVIGVDLSNLNVTVGSLGITAAYQSLNPGGADYDGKAISVVDAAMNLVNTSRSTIGAIQNRLESALNEAASYDQNLAASYSQIIDVDYAKESASMTRYQIMQQAGTAALGQANSIPQSIVSLLS